MVQSPSENLLSLRFKEFENSLLLLEIAAESEDWERFYSLLMSFCAMEQALTESEGPTLVGGTERLHFLVMVERFSRLMEVVERQREGMAKELAEIENRGRQVARLNRAYGS